MTLRQWRSGQVGVLVIAMIAGMLGITSDGQAQGKIRIAVTAFEKRVKTPIPNASWKIGGGLAEILTNELSKTRQFIIIERFFRTLKQECV